jgi:hypothetical protein
MAGLLRRLFTPQREIRKIFSNVARRISGCFALSRRQQSTLSEIKAPQPIIPD